MADSPSIPELRRPMMAERSEPMTALAKTNDTPAEPISISGGLLEVIARAARDPAVDIDKMERLLEMQERVIARQAREAYAVALAELQPKLPVITERGKILNKDKQVQSTYAYWEDVNEQIRPLLAEAGFSLSFRTGRNGADITVTGVLSHREGHSEETTMTLPSDGSGNKNAVQAIASSTSYGKRYTAFALLNITTKGEDDDGQTATKYQASGEPMPRAKLDGPHTSKTALRTAVHAIIAKVRAAESIDALAAIQKENIETIRQANVDWPSLLTGDPKVPDDIGLKGAVEQRRAELAGEGAVFTGLVESMRLCDTRGALELWKEQNGDVIASLDGEEGRRFEMLLDDYEAGLGLVETANA